MLLLLEESWARVQDALRERVGAAAYDAWVSGLRPVLLERGTVYLEADSRLVGDRVRTLFRQTLAEVLSKDFGIELKVEIQAREANRFDSLEVSPQQPIVDEGNRTAFLVLKSLLTASRQASVRRETAPQPLVPSQLIFLHGPHGVGKTFLLRWWREQAEPRPMWFDLPMLLKAFQSAHHEGRVESLADELCQPRPLVVDEAHRIARKPALQKFVLGVLRRREALAMPTLFASRWHPKEVHELDPSLCTSLLAGFVTSIDRPGPLGRLRYLRALAGSPSRNGQAQQVEAMAQQVVGSYTDLRAAWSALGGEGRPTRYLQLIDPRRVFHQVRDRVAEHFGVSATELVGKGQSRALSRARKVLALLCQQQGLNGGEIGRFLGRTRAAVSYMLLSLQEELDKSPELRRHVEELT